ncbi:MAG: hypothetical protein QOK40_899 [Miltoncostaeaceae bacterium]|nr:hypothetical protein [Miltoncostaeaceae bacterium]
MRRHRFVPALAALGLAVPSLAAAAPGAPAWTKISGPVGSSLAAPALGFSAEGVLAAWTVSGATSAAIQTVPLLPSRNGGVRTPPAPVAAADGWTTLAQTPVLIPKAGGGLQVLFAGARATAAGVAMSGGTVAVRNADGSFVQPAAASVRGPSGGTMDAVALPDGTPIWATDQGGVIAVLRGIGADQTRHELQSATVGGCCGFDPALAIDGSGAVWIAWYSNAPGAVGILVQRLDPVSGAPIGPAQIAPGSEPAVNNLNSHRVALACKPVGGGCRVVYATQEAVGAPATLVSWHPGDRAPVTVATINGLGTVALSASYTGDAQHLWVAWKQGLGSPSYHAVYGDPTGAGGSPIAIGAPPTAAQGAYGLTTVAVGNDLVLASLNGSPEAAVWANRISPPNPNATPNTLGIWQPRTIENGPTLAVAPRRFSLAGLRRFGCVPMRVQSTQPARVTVTILGGPRGRLSGSATAGFPRAGGGNQMVCVKIPIRPYKIDTRKPFTVGLTYQLGSRPKPGAPQARNVIKPFSFTR